jgi:hypothetical protein
MPEVALELIGLVRVLREHPAEEDVGGALARVLKEALSEVDVVAPDALPDLPVGGDAL